MGAYGSSPSPSSTQSPESRRPPASFVRRAASSRIRVLPTPDSPATKTSDGRPAAASENAASSSASSAARPIILLEVILAATTPVSPLADDVIGLRGCELGGQGGEHLALLASGYAMHGRLRRTPAHRAFAAALAPGPLTRPEGTPYLRLRASRSAGAGPLRA